MIVTGREHPVPARVDGDLEHRGIVADQEMGLLARDRADAGDAVVALGEAIAPVGSSATSMTLPAARGQRPRLASFKVVKDHLVPAGAVMVGEETALHDGTQYLDAHGSSRWPSTWWLDLSLNYSFNLWKTVFSTRLEIFNVFDRQKQIDGVIEDGPDFRKASGVEDYQTPRDYRLSLVLSW